MTRSVTLILAALALAFAPMLALAASVGDVANPIIDRVQGEIVIWIAGGVVSAVMGVAGWFGSLVGIRVVEKLNRDTLREAAERYANGLIDLAQARYLYLVSSLRLRALVGEDRRASVEQVNGALAP